MCAYDETDKVIQMHEQAASRQTTADKRKSCAHRAGQLLALAMR
jgi:hypothetical protein